MVAALNATPSTTQYPLKRSALLDSGATVHVFSNADRFQSYRPAEPGDYIQAGQQYVPIRGYGNVDIQTRCQTNVRSIRLFDVAHCENFPCNLVSLRQLQKRGYWWDNRPAHNCIRTKDNIVVCDITDKYDQFVIESIPEDRPEDAFVTRRHRFNSWTERGPTKAIARLWHLRLGHPGPQALEHLVNASRGVKIKGPTTTQCDSCAVSKIKRQVRREPRNTGSRPAERLAVDFHDLPRDPQDRSSVMLITDRWSGYIWDYYLVERTVVTIIAAFRDLFKILARHYQLYPQTVESDNEIQSEGGAINAYLRDMRVLLEPSAPHTQAQNGGAEASGRTIKEKARTMRTGARLPQHLWVEIFKAAVYLYNRTPRYIHDWRSPYEKLHTFLANRDGIAVENRKPHQAHLRAYGCKAFAMTTQSQRHLQKRQKLNPKAWIGYLVGYQSTNIYRIWNPYTGRVISTRDVIFNEEEHFNGNIEQLKDDLLHIGRDELVHLLNEVEIPETNRILMAEEDQVGASIPQTNWEGIHGEDEDVENQFSLEGPTLHERARDTGAEQLEVGLDHPTGTGEGSGISGVAEADRRLPEGGAEDQPEGGTDDQAKNSEDRSRPYPTPVSIPPTALLVMTIREGLGNTQEEDCRLWSAQEPIEVWKAAFVAGRLGAPRGTMAGKVIDKAKFQRLLKNPGNLHRRDMPPLPQSHARLIGHPMGSLFEEAEAEHLQSHKEMKSWIELDRYDPQVKGKQILDCMWVYVYKFDKHGRFKKCKARLVVRGDQQIKTIHEETYAATLAGRSFRILMAIAARFDMELIQYDAVNAFVNAKLENEVFMRMPSGYRKPGIILKLQKALYGLRESPLLWQKDLTATLQELGFDTVPHEPCCMTRRGIIIFYYVDDIVLAYKKGRESEIHRLMDKLQTRYKLTGGKPLQWFLGIEIIRDREKKLLWLSQSDYLDKIANLADRTDYHHNVPMRREELTPNEDRASLSSIRSYQRKIGSILYAAVITRPDVAFAAARLSRFNANPGPEHHVAADQVLLYLRKTKALALQFGGGDNFIVASDASFADNSMDRKSSQAYVMQLFGGTIGWRANKQSTVTTSTTEAELLALAQAAKESMFISRLISELGIQLDEQRIRIFCDNQQTIQLVNKDIHKLQTKLRHVDIHNHWLRQEVQQNKIEVDYKPTTDMIADGLTKALSGPTFQQFVHQIGLVDVSCHLEKRQLDDLNEETMLEEMAKLDLHTDEAVSAYTASTGGLC